MATTVYGQASLPQMHSLFSKVRPFLSHSPSFTAPFTRRRSFPFSALPTTKAIDAALMKEKWLDSLSHLTRRRYDSGECWVKLYHWDWPWFVWCVGSFEIWPLGFFFFCSGQSLLSRMVKVWGFRVFVKSIYPYKVMWIILCRTRLITRVGCVLNIWFLCSGQLGF